MTELKCVYCNSNPVGKSEHVFPKSLGGQSVYMDCVCNDCNNQFSIIERELFQKSIVALMRSEEGIEGYRKSKRRIAPLKYPEIFYPDKENRIVYEAGIHNGWSPYLRPQLILVDREIYGAASTNEELTDLINVFNEWRHNNLIMVTKFPSSKGEKYEAVKFVLVDGEFQPNILGLVKVRKEVIHYCLMEGNDEFKEYFEPRLFLTDSNELNVRSRNIEEGIIFINHLLNYCNQESAIFRTYPIQNSENLLLSTFKFNIKMMERALVKIGLNPLMHYYPVTKYNPLLNPAKEFVNNGKDFNTAISPKISFFDIDSKIHCILFYQLIEGLYVRVSLFGGDFIHSFFIHKLNLFPQQGHFSTVEINYKANKQVHLSMAESLLNIIQDIEQPINKQNI